MLADGHRGRSHAGWPDRRLQFRSRRAGAGDVGRLRKAGTGVAPTADEEEPRDTLAGFFVPSQIVGIEFIRHIHYADTAVIGS